jgi:hypothetical protein
MFKCMFGLTGKVNDENAETSWWNKVVGGSSVVFASRGEGRSEESADHLSALRRQVQHTLVSFDTYWVCFEC